MESKFWNGKSVLVTGVGGFVGSSLANHLQREGAKVTGISRTEPSHLNPGVEVFQGDITDYEFVRDVISSREVEYIYHMAAKAIVRISSRDPLSTYNTNVMGTVALLEAARNVGKCKLIVAASSDKAYGDHLELPYKEHFPLQPRNTYDTSKACSDMIARSYAHNYGMPVVVTRCSNIYGPGDYNFSRIIPNTIRHLLAGQSPVLYEDVENMEREFIYISDVVAAYDALAQNTINLGTAYNIGGNGPVRVSEIVRIMTELCGSDISPIILRRENEFKEIKRQYIDATLLGTLTGWSPKINLEHGLSRTIEWMKEVLP